MILKNCNLFGNNIDIEIENGKIKNIGKIQGEDFYDVKGKTVIPGLIDIHIHGANGFDTLSGNFEPICDFLARSGTTAWIPTLVTTSSENMKRITDSIPKVSGAKILGYHLEGPYISKDYKGAHDENYIKNPDLEELKSLKNVKLITLAPELPNALEMIKNCGISVSLGHSGSDFETAKKAFQNGAESITHTFNAMTPLHHRKPGIIGAAFSENCYAEIISDGFHVHPVNVLLIYRMFGDKMIIVSDALECTGLKDGKYDLGGKTFTMKDNTAIYEDGTIVGGTHTLFQCVKKAVEFGVPFEDAVKSASEIPAKRFGLNKGKIALGYDADILILDENLEIEKVMVDGNFYD